MVIKNTTRLMAGLLSFAGVGLFSSFGSTFLMNRYEEL
jgi:hypothetical protein